MNLFELLGRARGIESLYLEDHDTKLKKGKRILFIGRYMGIGDHEAGMGIIKEINGEGIVFSDYHFTKIPQETDLNNPYEILHHAKFSKENRAGQGSKHTTWYRLGGWSCAFVFN